MNGRAIRILLMLAVGALPLLVAACGSSSSASTGASASTSSTTTPNFRSAAGRAQLATCLKKQGVTLPQRRQGGPPAGGAGGGGGNGGGGGGFLFGGGNGGGNGNGRPSGNFRNSKLANALRKCGVTPGQGAGGGFRAGANGARFNQALTKFVACMKQNGYPLPKPNTSGKGPVFDASKVNRNDPKFKSAAQKCQSLLRLGPQPGGGNGSPPGATTTAQ
ncbi:MAG TPA: hypothetical protein VGI67_02885 [Thermoleophilaceae bacterium]|jgi:hypothetical protein